MRQKENPGNSLPCGPQLISLLSPFQSCLRFVLYLMFRVLGCTLSREQGKVYLFHHVFHQKSKLLVNLKISSTLTQIFSFLPVDFSTFFQDIIYFKSPNSLASNYSQQAFILKLTDVSIAQSPILFIIWSFCLCFLPPLCSSLPPFHSHLQSSIMSGKGF